MIRDFGLIGQKKWYYKLPLMTSVNSTDVEKFPSPLIIINDHMFPYLLLFLSIIIPLSNLEQEGIFHL